MSIDLSPYEIELLDTIDLVTKLNAALNAVEDGVNTEQESSAEAYAEFVSTVDARIDDQDATIDSRLGSQDLIIAAWQNILASGRAFKGFYNASLAVYPSTPTTGDSWIITTAGTISSIYHNIGDTIVYGGSTWIRIPANPSMKEINPLAKAVRVAMTGAASPAIKVLSSTIFNPGNGNFTLFHRVKPNGIQFGSGTQHLSIGASSSSVLPLLRFDLVGGVIKPTLVIAGAGYLATVSLTLNDFLVGALWEITCVRQSVSTAGSVVIYKDGYQFGAAIPIPAGTPHTFTGGDLYIEGFSSSREPCDWFETGIYNRALSATESLDLSINGPALADIGASQTPIDTFDFSAGVDGFAGFRATLTGNTDSIGGKDNTLKAEITNTGSPQIYKAYTAAQVGYGSRTKFQIYIPSTNVTTNQISVHLRDVYTGSVFSVALIVSPTPDTWVDVEYSQLGTGLWTTLQIYPTASTGTTTVGDLIYVASDGDVKKTGFTGWWNAEDCQGNTGQIHDRSGNKNHAKLPASGATRIPVKREFEIRWTNTWAGTHEAQYIGGVNEAILNANAYITSIVGRVTGASSQTIIVGDGSATSKFVSSVTIVTGTQVFAVASATNDGTNLKMVADPNANFTGSIAWTIRGYILEV